MESSRSLKALLSDCDKGFRPYVEKVMQRLPDKVRDDLYDSRMKIVSFDAETNLGFYMSFDSPIEHLIILNKSLLKEPEFKIVHAIAHELAHKAARGKTSLHEMEAEKLVVKWGFGKESKMVNYSRPILETSGFKIGYEWAKKNDLAEFEEFYDEWNEGRLSTKRYEALFYAADTTSILDQMGCLEEPMPISPNGNIEIPEGTMGNDGSLDRGIIEGIMRFLRKKKVQERRTAAVSEESEFTERLNRIFIEMGGVLSGGTFSKHFGKLPSFRDAYMEILGLLKSE